MDTFFEQIVEIRKTGLDWLKLAGIWLLAGVLLFVFFLLGVNNQGFMSILALLCIGIIYGAFWLSKRLSVEYEYIVTNGTLDVDKIIARSSRKRELSCELSGVERVEKYNPAAPVVGNFKKQVIACNPTDPEAYFMVINEEGKGSRLLVFAPDERIRGAVVKSMPKFIANSAFK